MKHPYLKKLSLILIAPLILGVPVLASAQNQQTDIRPQALRLTGDDLRAQFEGITHNGAYNFTFEGRGLNNYSEMHYPDGRVVYQEDDLKAEGVWFINRNNVCFVYENSAMTGGCFRVYKVANCYYYYSDQIREMEGELDRDYWTARSVHKGQAPECDSAIS